MYCRLFCLTSWARTLVKFYARMRRTDLTCCDTFDGTEVENSSLKWSLLRFLPMDSQSYFCKDESTVVDVHVLSSLCPYQRDPQKIRLSRTNKDPFGLHLSLLLSSICRRRRTWALSSFVHPCVCLIAMNRAFSFSLPSSLRSLDCNQKLQPEAEVSHSASFLLSKHKQSL